MVARGLSLGMHAPMHVRVSALPHKRPSRKFGGIRKSHSAAVY